MIIGLTGGIGSGKSVVASVFEILGAVIFNSDLVAKEAYLEPEISKRVIALLGNESYLPSGLLNKTFVGKQIFSDTKLMQELNAIIHPAVRRKMDEFVKKHSTKILIKESALLFEAQLENEVDKIVVVTAPDDLRIERVLRRDGLSQADAKLRLESQIPQEEKNRRADYVIYNDESHLVIPQVIEVFEKINASKK